MSCILVLVVDNRHQIFFEDETIMDSLLTPCSSILDVLFTKLETKNVALNGRTLELWCSKWSVIVSQLAALEAFECLFLATLQSSEAII